MIQIRVSGEKVSETGEYIDIIQRALQAAGKRTIVAKANEITGGRPGHIDCVVAERPLPTTTADPRKFDYLIGLTEAAAYELAQDAGCVVRIWMRNGEPVPGPLGLLKDRVSLSVAHNIVVGWHIG